MSNKKKYDLKINYDLYLVFEKYLNDNPQLGYRSVSELLNDIIRRSAKKFLKGEDLD